jgi:hypothetical protein
MQTNNYLQTLAVLERDRVFAVNMGELSHREYLKTTDPVVAKNVRRWLRNSALARARREAGFSGR